MNARRTAATRPAMRKSVHEQALERLRNATPEYINDLTVRAGVYDSEGNLTPECGGKKKRRREVKKSETWLTDAMVANGFAPSKSAARRLILVHAVHLDGKIVVEPNLRLVPGEHTVRVGNMTVNLTVEDASGYTACGAMAPVEERTTHEAVARGHELRASVSEEEWEAICETPIEDRQSDTWADEMGIVVAGVRAKL